MKKIILYTLLLAAPLCATAQKYALYKGDTINRMDKKGRRQGIWKRYYRNDTLYYSGYFKDNVPVGTFTYHIRDGRIQCTNRYYDNGKKSFCTAYYPTGRVQARGIYVNHQKDSVWKYYDDFEQLTAVEFYKNTLPDGVWYTYYTDTASKASEITWDKGHRTGPWRMYYRSGVLKTDANMVDSNFVGLVKVYYPTGHIRFLGHYNNKGMADSTWTFYRETPEGEVDHTDEYRYGTSIARPAELDEPLNDSKTKPENPKKESEE